MDGGGERHRTGQHRARQELEPTADLSWRFALVRPAVCRVTCLVATMFRSLAYRSNLADRPRAAGAQEVAGLRSLATEGYHLRLPGRAPDAYSVGELRGECQSELKEKVAPLMVSRIKSHRRARLFGASIATLSLLSIGFTVPSIATATTLIPAGADLGAC